VQPWRWRARRCTFARLRTAGIRPRQPRSQRWPLITSSSSRSTRSTRFVAPV